MLTPTNTEPTLLNINTTPTTAELTLQLPSELTYFQGHFPEAAILPGVAQLDWAIKFAAQHLQCQGEVKSVEVLKFQVVLMPEQQVTLKLEKKHAHKFTFSYHSEKGQHASGRIVLNEHN